MQNPVRRLPWKIEFAIVLGLAFGWTLPATLHSLLASAAPARSGVPLIIGDTTLWDIIHLELIVLSLLVPFLYLRGWTFRRLGIRPSLRGSLLGGFLALIAYGMFFRLALLVGNSWPEAHHTLIHTRILGWGYSWTPVVLVCIINSFYEEVFVCGYVISVLTEMHTVAVRLPKINENVEGKVARNNAARLAAAVTISVAIRLSCHLYQGIPGLLAIVPMGLLFGIWFARTRQLWPLIVAHALYDFVGLAARTR